MRKFLFFALVFFVGSSLFAQTADTAVVLEVAGEKVLKSDFVRMFKKNSPNKAGGISQEELDEYLELFINYKMKLAQARELGLDTLKSYLEETDQYRKQLVAPYLNDATVSAQLVQEAYDREKEIVRAAHILVNIPANATPADTLAAYNKALQLRKRVLAGEDFAALAREFSDDPSAKDRVNPQTNATVKGNGGDIGYFSSMSMIYPFENACYSMKVGEISMPVRTRFGYHVVKLIERVPAFCSTMDVEHIWVSGDKYDQETGEKRIFEAWNEIKGGASFDSVVRKYSDDGYSLSRGGMLSNQTVSSLPTEYIEQLRNLSIGQLSEPFRSNIGWHIVKPINYKPIAPFEKQKAQIEQRIAKDERSYKTIESFAEKAKTEYGFRENRELLGQIVKIMTDSVFSASWKVPSDFDNSEELFRIGDYSYTLCNFAKEIEANQRRQTPEYIPEFINKCYKEAVLEQIVRYADSRLEDKYPELKATIDEFRDGILIFAITDKQVWNKSVADTSGLREFYLEHKDNYKWDTRAEVTLWSVNCEKINPKKLNKILTKAIKKSWGEDKTKAAIAKAYKIEDADKQISFRYGKFEKGDNAIVDRTVWSASNPSENSVISDTASAKRDIAVVFHKFVQPETKTLDECKGAATSDYQSVLEQQWLKELRGKYDYNVNKEVYNSIR